MYRRLPWLIAVVFLADAGFFADSAWAQLSPAARQIAARLTPNSLKADVSFLASDALQGRATPSPGLDIAAEYIAAQFRRAGLEPGGDDGYFESVPGVVVTPNPAGFQCVLFASEKSLRISPHRISLAGFEAVTLDRVLLLCKSQQI